MKLLDILIIFITFCLMITTLNCYLPKYNKLLEGMCNKIGMCDFKPLTKREENKLYNNISDFSNNSNSPPLMSLEPDAIDPNNTPEWPIPCDASYTQLSGEYVIFDNKLDHKKFEKEKDKISLSPEQKENIEASVGEQLPPNYMTHLPTEPGISPFKKQEESPVNQIYQQLYDPGKFTVNYPCHKSITGAFTYCGPKGFNGFCPNSNFFLAGEV